MGDDNIRYFYFVIKHRKLKQATIQLKDNHGNWQTNPDTIARLIVRNYWEERQIVRHNIWEFVIKWNNAFRKAALNPFIDKDAEATVFVLIKIKAPNQMILVVDFTKQPGR